jgi:hypothetical protein
VYRGFRDYFHGLGERDATDPPPPPGIISRPHRSVVYRRERPTGERHWSVAFTVPVTADGADSKPIGVVGMTIDLEDAPAERDDHFAVLIDTRPDKTGRRGLILRHPYWATMKGDPEPPLYYAEAVVKWADEAAAGDESVPFAGGAAYIDPVSVSIGDVSGQPGYGGRWLASVNRVRVGPEKVDTGWVVLVQERRDAVLQPVRDLQWRLGYVGAAAAVIVLGLVVLMWGGVMMVMDTSSRSPVTRFLRRWAGLPAVGTAGTSGTIGGSSLPAAGTSRESGNGTPTPGQ